MVENKNRLVASTEPVANHSSGGQENAALAVLTRDSIRKGVHMMRILNGNAELTINQTSTLSQLKEGPRPMALMARLSGVSQPSMSQHASALEALGYIKRSRAPQDGRAVILSITDSGREAVDRVNLTRNSALQELFAQLSAEERDSLTSGLRVLEQLAESTIQDSSRNS